MTHIVAVKEQRAASATALGSTVGDSSPADAILPKEKAEEKFGPLGLQIQHIPLKVLKPSSPARNQLHMEPEFHLEEGIKRAPSVEHQFIPSFTKRSPLHQNNMKDRVVSENLSLLRNGSDDDVCVLLQLGEREAKRRRSDPSSAEEPK